MFTVALTGGIASGKSSVARYFEKLGVTVIDADAISHRLTKHHSDVLQKIVDLFGRSILTKDGQLNRSQLHDIIFSNAEDRNRLEQILHPLIYEEMHASLETAKSIYCLLVIPLLFAGKTINLVRKKPGQGKNIELNRILLIISTKELQCQRSTERDQLKQGQIEAVLSAQTPPTESLHKADDILYNNTTLGDVEQAVKRFHHMYVSFAQSKKITLEQSAFLRYYLSIK